MGEAQQEILEKVYSARDLDELAAGYSEWARQYDRDVMVMGYQLPGIVAGLVGRHVPRTESPILDCGAGTGLVGMLLRALGYSGMTAIDMSEAMLGLAHERGCYERIQRAVLGRPLELPDDHFATIVAVGVFTAGHAPAEAYDELARVLRPGGVFIVSERVDGDANAAYRARREALEAEGRWALVEASERFQAFPLEAAEAHVVDQVLVYRGF